MIGALPGGVRGLTLDAGGLVAIDRGDERVLALLRLAGQEGGQIAVPAGALGQAWRDGSRQARLAQLIKRPEISVVTLDERGAKAAGLLCGRARHHDLIEASVALCAQQRGHAVVTSDPDDIARLGPKLRVIAA